MGSDPITPEQLAVMFPMASRDTMAANAVSKTEYFPVDDPVRTMLKAARSAKGPNKTEAAFGQILEARKRNGEILEYAFEPFSLRYGEGAYYKPDWVYRTGGERTIAEVTRICEASIIDMSGEIELWRIYADITKAVRHFTIVEVKGAFVYPEAKPRFKAAKLRHQWAEWEMHQRIKGEWSRIL